MRANRKQRLATVLFVLGGVAVTVALTLLALEENVNLFYEPAKVVGGEAPRGVSIRAGGMVVAGSVEHDSSGLGVRFALTDYQATSSTWPTPAFCRACSATAKAPSLPAVWTRAASSKPTKCSPNTTRTTCRRNCTTSPKEPPTPRLADWPRANRRTSKAPMPSRSRRAGRISYALDGQ